MIPMLIIVLVIIVFYCWKDRRQMILEGVIIGVIAGICISYLTDADYRATVNGPLINIVRKYKIDWKYTSKDWSISKAEKVGDGRYDLKATNIATGNTVVLNNKSISNLPPDLKYGVETWGAPDNVVGGSSVTTRK
ncbi:hypothetical protein ACFL42_03165 [Candidatus Omnitrophota bacterium]